MALVCISAAGFRLQGSFRVQVKGFWIQGEGLRVYGMVSNSACKGTVDRPILAFVIISEKAPCWTLLTLNCDHL